MKDTNMTTGMVLIDTNDIMSKVNMFHRELWEDDSKFIVIHHYTADVKTENLVVVKKEFYKVYKFNKPEYNLEDMKNFCKGGAELMITEKLFGVGKTSVVTYGNAIDEIVPIEEWDNVILIIITQIN